MINHQLISLLRTHNDKKDNQSQSIKLFNELLYGYYWQHKRAFSWREQITPYRVLVSEIMLQQTQTERVKEKFELFINYFPDFYSLAQASFDQVLTAWKGLGYNRRARALHAIAQDVMREKNGYLPTEPQELQKYKGIGTATAASICTFAYNKPTVFIETNIRTVFIYVFFPDKKEIHDKEILPLIEAALDKNNPREWYYALMDYGVMLKKELGNFSRLSVHYTKQSRFEGSDRQLRGKILACLLEHTKANIEFLAVHTQEQSPERLYRIIAELEKDFLIEQAGQYLMIKQ